MIEGFYLDQSWQLKEGCKVLVVRWFVAVRVFTFLQELNWVRGWFLLWVCFSFYSYQMDGGKLTDLNKDWVWTFLL